MHDQFYKKSYNLVIPAKAGIQWRALHADIGFGWIPCQARNDEIDTFTYRN